MNKKELLKLGESQKLEFKKSLAEKEEILEAISAFANKKGGEILVGIEENKDGSVKEIVGIEIKGKMIESLTNEIKQNTDPVIFPSVEIKKIQSRDVHKGEAFGTPKRTKFPLSVLSIEVEENPFKPVFAKGKAFIRVGRTNRKLSSQEIRKLAKDSVGYNFTELVCKGAKLEDIDEEKVKWFVREARKQRGLKLSETLSIKDVLMKLKLLKNKKLTNACMLLFSKEPEFLQSEVKCIRFSGNEPVKPYIDFQTIQGNVFDLVDRAEDFVLRNIKKAIWLVPGQIQREEKHEYPPDAIREAITNAVVHRDYDSPSKVQVRVFDDYIEIWNPGKLPEGWTVEKLKQKHESVPKNPLLFKQLFWVKYVEDVGGGTLDIINECGKWGIPEPEFEDTGTSIVVTFRRSVITEKLMSKLGLNERQKKCILHINKKGKITRSEYEKIFGVHERQANRELKQLLEWGLIERHGSGYNVYYVLSRQKMSRSVEKNKLREIQNESNRGFREIRIE